MTDVEIRDVRRISIILFDNDSTLVLQALDLRSIKSHHWKIWSCSAVTGENLLTGLDWVVDDVAGRLYYSSTATGPSPLQAVPVS